jgi:hypothetical protein
MWRQEPVRGNRAWEALERASGKRLEEEPGGAVQSPLRDDDGLGFGHRDEAGGQARRWRAPRALSVPERPGRDCGPTVLHQP